MNIARLADTVPQPLFQNRFAQLINRRDDLQDWQSLSQQLSKGIAVHHAQHAELNGRWRISTVPNVRHFGWGGSLLELWVEAESSGGWKALLIEDSVPAEFVPHVAHALAVCKTSVDVDAVFEFSVRDGKKPKIVLARQAMVLSETLTPLFLRAEGVADAVANFENQPLLRLNLYFYTKARFGAKIVDMRFYGH